MNDALRITTRWQDAAGSTMLYHADNLAVLGAMAPDSANHCFTDPPYGDFVHANARSAVVNTSGGNTVAESGPALSVDFAPIALADLRFRLELIGRIVRRWVVFTCDDGYAAQLKRDPPPGLRFAQMGVYVRENSTPSLCGLKPAQGFDLVCVMHTERNAMRWNGGGLPAVWQHMVPRGAKAHGHPTQKPLSLGLEWVRQFSDPGETILDPWMGSGTFPEAAKRLGRKAIGVESDAKWWAHSCQRLSQGALFGGTDT